MSSSNIYNNSLHLNTYSSTRKRYEYSPHMYVDHINNTTKSTPLKSKNTTRNRLNLTNEKKKSNLCLRKKTSTKRKRKTRFDVKKINNSNDSKKKKNQNISLDVQNPRKKRKINNTI